ncbi:Uncharacterised protein [uncultured Clostridium sp.]|jgi:methionine-rich copper-binding protein CopC|nr:Uncharacterised protein [uncultured Clostridium sp.]
MKKFSKLFLSCAAVAAVTAAVATSAMAAGEISAEYSAETASLKITTKYTADQKTLLIVPSSVSLDKVTADDVVQIDQNAEIVDVALPADLKDGKYTVYMGGDGQVYSTNFKVGTGTDEEYIVGDSNSDGKIRTGDANAILWYTVDDKAVEGKSFNVGKKIVTADGELAIGDSNKDGKIRTGDANAILWYTVDDKAVDGKSFNVGETVTGQLAE